MPDENLDYYSMRLMALNILPDQLSLSPTEEFPSVFGVFMEIGMAEGAVTLVTLADGTVSLYYEAGGGIEDSGRHERVKEAAFRFIQAAEQMKEKFVFTTKFPLPLRGKVNFYVLTFDGVRTTEVGEEDLTEDNPLSELIVIGNEVLTQLRKAQDKGETKVPRFKDKKKLL